MGAGLSIWIMGLFIGMTDNLGAVGPTQSFAATASRMVFSLTYLLLSGEIVAVTDFKTLGFYCFSWPRHVPARPGILPRSWFHAGGLIAIRRLVAHVGCFVLALLGLLGTRQDRVGSIYRVLYGFHRPVYRVLSGHHLFQFGAYRLVIRVTSTRREVVWHAKGRFGPASGAGW